MKILSPDLQRIHKEFQLLKINNSLKQILTRILRKEIRLIPELDALSVLTKTKLEITRFSVINNNTIIINVSIIQISIKVLNSNRIFYYHR
jgi:hypothetical protein